MYLVAPLEALSGGRVGSAHAVRPGSDLQTVHVVPEYEMGVCPVVPGHPVCEQVEPLDAERVGTHMRSPSIAGDSLVAALQECCCVVIAHGFSPERQFIRVAVGCQGSLGRECVPPARAFSVVRWHIRQVQVSCGVRPGAEVETARARQFGTNSDDNEDVAVGVEKRSL